MLIESRGLHANAAINRTHRASTGTTGDADIRGAAPDQEAAFLPPSPPPSPHNPPNPHHGSSHSDSVGAATPSPSELHVMVLMLLPGWLEEDGSACLYTSAAPEKTRRRRAAAE